MTVPQRKSSVKLWANPMAAVATDQMRTQTARRIRRSIRSASHPIGNDATVASRLNAIPFNTPIWVSDRPSECFSGSVTSNRMFRSIDAKTVASSSTNSPYHAATMDFFTVPPEIERRGVCGIDPSRKIGCLRKYSPHSTFEPRTGRGARMMPDDDPDRARARRRSAECAQDSAIVSLRRELPGPSPGCSSRD